MKHKVSPKSPCYKTYNMLFPARPFMMHHFKWYWWICAASGIPFVRNIRCADEVRATWKICYPVYEAVCFALYAFIQVLYFFQIYFAIFSNVHVFITSLYVLMYIVITLKPLLNLWCISLFSSHLLLLFQEAGSYEKQVIFLPLKHCRPTAARHIIRCLLVVAFLVNVFVSNYLSFKFVDYLKYSKALSALLKTAATAGNILYYVYDIANFLIVRPCCEVFRFYIAHQHEILRSVVESSGVGVDFAKRATTVENVRRDLGKLAQLKGRLDYIFGGTLVGSGITVLLITCIAVYLAFVEEFWTLEHLLSIMYTLFSWLDLFDITNLSHEMTAELNNIRDTLDRAPSCCANPEYFNQVLYLQRSLKPKEIALCGGGFFTLKRTLIVSLAGSVITYTVILVQTSQAVKGGSQAP